MPFLEYIGRALSKKSKVYEASGAFRTNDKDDSGYVVKIEEDGVH